MGKLLEITIISPYFSIFRPKGFSHFFSHIFINNLLIFFDLIKENNNLKRYNQGRGKKTKEKKRDQETLKLFRTLDIPINYLMIKEFKNNISYYCRNILYHYNIMEDGLANEVINQEPVIFKDIQKRTRIMSQDMLDKLAVARIKAVARKKELSGAGNQLKIDYLQAKMDKIKLVKESKVVVPIETPPKKKRTPKKPVQEPTQELELAKIEAELEPEEYEEEEEETPIPPPPTPKPKRQPKKKIVIEETLSEQEDNDPDVVYIRKPKKIVPVPFRQQTSDLPNIQNIGFGRRF